ncbi:G-box binding factor [Sarracenia purpurea var. burkii]
MGAGEERTFAKPSKPNCSTQEIPATPSYPDWSSSMQAYYGGGTAPFFATTIASPTPHPYLWGSQHALLPPYGTPVPYPALYPPGGVYVHPNMAMAPIMGQTNVEFEGKSVDGKHQTSNKNSKGTPGNTSLIVGRGGEIGNTASGSGYDGGTQSAESGSEGSSDPNDENNNQEYAATASKKGCFGQMLADGANARNNTAGDERELKRQKRKLSNRESARRSRLRKQAECEELQARVEALTNENCTLRDELQRFSEECEKLKSENNSIKEELTRLSGSDAVLKLANNH